MFWSILETDNCSRILPLRHPGTIFRSYGAGKGTKINSNRSPFRCSGFMVYDFFIFFLLISVKAHSANFKARMNSALDSKSKTLTTLTVEL